MLVSQFGDVHNLDVEILVNREQNNAAFDMGPVADFSSNTAKLARE